ncbi:DUF5813 family protein [Halorubrum tibetense]|uniref:DUF5813 family protein n=1 Tax=Halorubrum tibetense TaxID=175631 RepID=A0ABD5SCY1_9EURY
MSDLERDTENTPAVPGRVRRAFSGHGSFEPAAAGVTQGKTDEDEETDGDGETDGDRETDGDGKEDSGAATDDEEPSAAVWSSETTAFDGTVTVASAEDGRLRFSVSVRVPTLSAVTTDDVADVVETGWLETFERRVVDVGGVTRGDHAFDPDVGRADDEVVVRFELTDSNERRGVDDAGALIDFVEGTYVQGIIPGYEYTEPVSGLISSARRQGGDAEGGAF